MADWIPRVLCRTCQGVHFGTYMFCQICRVPAYRGPPVPRTTEAPVVIVDSKLNERIREVRVALECTTGQRKSRVADNFDGFVRARTRNVRGWQTATDVDVFE